MKTLLQLLIWMLVAAAGGAYGAAPADNLVGQWRGSLPVDAKTSLTIQLDIARRPDNSYAVVLDSPENGAIKNTPASKVTFSAGKLQFEVPALSGSYSGELKNGVLAGEWKQSTGALPLSFSPYKAAQLSKAAIDTLKGTWVGPVELPAGLKLTTVLTFRVDDKGVLTGTVRSPDQGGGEAPMTSIEFGENRFKARVPVAAADISLTLDGDTMKGFLKQPNMPGEGAPLTVKRGEYVAPVYALSTNEETRKLLAGKWSGQLTPPANAAQGAPANPRRLTVTFRTNEKNQFVGVIDFPDPPKSELPIQDLLLNGTKLTLKFGPNGVLQYAGDLAGKTLTGEWIAGPNKLPLVLTRN